MSLCFSKMSKLKKHSVAETEASGNYQFVTTTFFGQKITTVQIRFCNDRYPSRIDKGNNNEHIEMTLLATHCPEK